MRAGLWFPIGLWAGPCGMVESMPTSSDKRLWFWVIFAFLLLLSAWGAFFYVARKHPVQEVPLQQQIP